MPRPYILAPLNFANAFKLDFLFLGLIQNVLADSEIFVGDAVGLKENPFGPRLRRAAGDDLIQRDDVFPASDAALARFNEVAAVGLGGGDVVGDDEIHVA